MIGAVVVALAFVAMVTAAAAFEVKNFRRQRYFNACVGELNERVSQIRKRRSGPVPTVEMSTMERRG